MDDLWEVPFGLGWIDCWVGCFHYSKDCSRAQNSSLLGLYSWNSPNIFKLSDWFWLASNWWLMVFVNGHPSPKYCFTAKLTMSTVKRFWGKTSLSEWLTTLIGARATSQMAQRATRPVYHIHSMQQHMSRGERCGWYNLTLWSQVCKVCIVRTLHTQLPNALSPWPGPARHLVWPADGMVLSVIGLTGSFHTVWVPPFSNMSHGYDSLYPM